MTVKSCKFGSSRFESIKFGFRSVGSVLSRFWVGYGSVLGIVSILGHIFGFVKSLDQSLTRIESIGIGSSNNNSSDEFHTFNSVKTVFLLLQY